MLCVLPAFARLPQYSIVTTDIPTADSGSIVRYSVHAATVDDDYTVDVWVPDAYSSDDDTDYPVVYVQDGQNLFDKKFSFANVAWELDGKTQSLIQKGYIVSPIIVGISNRGAGNLRANDYFPEKALNFIAEEDKSDTKVFQTCASGFYGDEYAAFVATELKPLIDNLYRTNPDRSHTFAMGSSMGALISLYLLCEYPDTFGGAACLSTHWIGSLDLNADYTMNDDQVCANAILAYLDAALPSPSEHRLYFDQGTTGWDAGYLKYEPVARLTAESHGYSTDAGTLMTYDARGAGHNEWFWQQRADRPLKFLLDKSYFASTPVIVTPTVNDRRYISLSGLVFECDDTSLLCPGIYINAGRKIVIR